MSKIDSTLAQTLRNASRKFASPTEFAEAVVDIVTRKSSKAELEVIKQFEIVGAYFTKLAGKPVDATPAMIDSSFEANIGTLLIRVSIQDGDLEAGHSINLAAYNNGPTGSIGATVFEYEGTKASQVIKKWEGHVRATRKQAVLDLKKTIKALDKLLPKAKKEKVKAERKPVGIPATAEDGNEGW